MYCTYCRLDMLQPPGSAGTCICPSLGSEVDCLIILPAHCRVWRRSRLQETPARTRATDDEAKLQSVTEREPRSHRKRKAELLKQKPAAREGAYEAIEAAPAQKRPHLAASEPAGKQATQAMHTFSPTIGA